jgi:hypothetical protein
MQVRDDDVDPLRMIAPERHPEGADAGAGVEDQQRAVRQVDAHARGFNPNMDGDTPSLRHIEPRQIARRTALLAR